MIEGVVLTAMDRRFEASDNRPTGYNGVEKCELLVKYLFHKTLKLSGG